MEVSYAVLTFTKQHRVELLKVRVSANLKPNCSLLFLLLLHAAAVLPFRYQLAVSRAVHNNNRMPCITKRHVSNEYSQTFTVSCSPSLSAHIIRTNSL